MELNTLLANIKREADRLRREGLSSDDAYGRAITTEFRLAAELQEAEPFDKRIIEVMEEAARDQGLVAVSTHVMMVRLGISNRFTMHNYLQSLERRGLIHRPFGERSKSGWAVKPEARQIKTGT